MKAPRTLLAAATAAALSVALVGAPAVAKPPQRAYTHFATMDCGSGAFEVGSWSGVWAPLVDLESGKRYKPIEWELRVGERLIHEARNGGRGTHVVCGYRDEVASGTVTVIVR